MFPSRHSYPSIPFSTRFFLIYTIFLVFSFGSQSGRSAEELKDHEKKATKAPKDFKKKCNKKKDKERRDCNHDATKEANDLCKTKPKGKERKECLQEQTGSPVVAEFGEFDVFGLPLPLEVVTQEPIGQYIEAGTISQVEIEAPPPLDKVCIQVQNQQPTELEIESKEGSYFLVDTYNIAGVTCGNPSSLPEFSTTKPEFIEFIRTYHWCDGGADSQISLINTKTGTVLGPFPTHYEDKNNRRADVSFILPPGTYRVVDSIPGSWSHTGGAGFAQVSARAGEANVLTEPWDFFFSTRLVKGTIHGVCGGISEPECPMEFQSHACSLLKGKVLMGGAALCNEGDPIPIEGADAAQSLDCTAEGEPDDSIMVIKSPTLLSSLRVFHKIDQTTSPEILIHEINKSNEVIKSLGPFKTTLLGYRSLGIGWKSLLTIVLQPGRYKISTSSKNNWCRFGGKSTAGYVEAVGTQTIPEILSQCGFEVKPKYTLISVWTCDHSGSTHNSIGAYCSSSWNWHPKCETLDPYVGKGFHEETCGGRRGQKHYITGQGPPAQCGNYSLSIYSLCVPDFTSCSALGLEARDGHSCRDLSGGGPIY